MSNSLEERLRINSQAFDGLLALIPAKYYYDDKTQEQWKAKKKSKSQSTQDRMKKLDPEDVLDEGSSALEVLKKKEKDAKPVVLPGEKMKLMKQMKAEEIDDEEGDGIDVIFDDDGNEISGSESEEEREEEEDEQEIVEPLKEGRNQDSSTSENTKKAKKVISEEERLNKQKKLEELRAKLQNKIQSMRMKRKAPGSNVEGAPLSREAILKQRHLRADLKKQRKEQQELVNEESESEDESDDDVGDNDIIEPENKKRKLNDKMTKDIMFQNIVFDDGDKVTSDLQKLRKASKKGGPSRNDAKAHLKILETRKAKLESKDELDQIKLKEKQKWQKTMLQAEGVKLKNDEKLLRKAVKRKEAKKRKSALEWKERKRAVTDNIADRQKRREENLQIRRDNKGKKRSKQQKMKRKFTAKAIPNLPKKQKRAGFEGSLKMKQTRK